MQLLLCTSSIGKWFLRKIEEVKHKVSQNLSKSPHETQRVTYTVCTVAGPRNQTSDLTGTGLIQLIFGTVYNLQLQSPIGKGSTLANDCPAGPLTILGSELWIRNLRHLIIFMPPDTDHFTRSR